MKNNIPTDSYMQYGATNKPTLRKSGGMELPPLESREKHTNKTKGTKGLNE